MTRALTSKPADHLLKLFRVIQQDPPRVLRVRHRCSHVGRENGVRNLAVGFTLYEKEEMATDQTLHW